MDNKEFQSTTIHLNVKLAKESVGVFKKAIASYFDDTLPDSVDQEDVSAFLDKQPDLLYALSIFVSSGRNKNGDCFLNSILASIFRSPRNKFVDFEHDVQGTNEGKNNPKRYEIIGHIYDSVLSVQNTGEYIPEEEVIKGEDGKWFNIGSKYRNQSLDILVAWVLYKFEFPEIVDWILSQMEKNPDGFGVSMEVLFNDYKFRIGGTVDPINEDFEFDGNSIGALEVRKGQPLAERLQDLWLKGKGRTYDGKTVTRILGGDIFFSGMAITANRANTRSINLSVASQIQQAKASLVNDNDNVELINMIKAVSSRSGGSFDMAKECELKNGEPTCDCMSKAAASEIETFEGQIEDLQMSLSEVAALYTAESIKKRKDVNPKSGKNKYGNVKFADEKNKKYPIDTEAHIRAAWNYINKSKNSGKYGSEDVKSIKAKIIRAWKKKIDKNGPPSAAKGSNIWAYAGWMESCPMCTEPETGSIDGNTDPRPDVSKTMKDHYDWHLNDLHNGIITTMHKFNQLTATSLDEDSSMEETLDLIEELEDLLTNANSNLAFLMALYIHSGDKTL